MVFFDRCASLIIFQNYKKVKVCAQIVANGWSGKNDQFPKRENVNLADASESAREHFLFSAQTRLRVIVLQTCASAPGRFILPQIYYSHLVFYSSNRFDLGRLMDLYSLSNRNIYSKSSRVTHRGDNFEVRAQCEVQCPREFTCIYWNDKYSGFLYCIVWFECIVCEVPCRCQHVTMTMSYHLWACDACGVQPKHDFVVHQYIGELLQSLLFSHCIVIIQK